MDEYVFLSYNHEDTKELIYYKENLEKHNVNIKFDGHMHAGEDWEQKAKRFIRNIDCKCVIFFISDNSIKSEPLLIELGFAVKYNVPYFAVILDGDDIKSKFEKLRQERASDDVLDIAEGILDHFPDEKIYISHSENTISKILDSLKAYIKIDDDAKKYRYKIIEGQEVTKEDIMSALELDRKYYSMPDDEQFTVEKCMNWYNINNQIYTMIKDTETNKIVGYINATPVTDECYNDIRNGKYADVNIDDNDVEDYLIPAKYNLYFASIVVDYEAHSFTVLKKLCDAFFEKLIKLLDNDFIISRVVADAISKYGQKLCERFGMKKVLSSSHESLIYELELFPPKFDPTSEKLKELFDSFNEKYESLKK